MQFTVDKKNIDKNQLWLILHHNECFDVIGHNVINVFQDCHGLFDTGWNITETNDIIVGVLKANWDFFDMPGYMDLCGIHAVFSD